MPPMRFHELRHGFATIMLALGVSERTIQQAMGHSDPRITLGTYVHVPIQLLHEAAGRLDGAFGSS